ncbi:MAG: hypothetical protein ABRQ26_13010 [Syntrophomonadaceae bacterium]
MNFFCTKNQYQEWAAQTGVNPETVFCLDADEALMVAKMLFE